MVLHNLVQDTLRKNRMDAGLSHQIVTALTISGIPSIVKEADVTKIERLIYSQATVVASMRNPLRAAASINNTNSVQCPYCHDPLKKISINGDLIKSAGFCERDRITLPFVKQ